MIPSPRRRSNLEGPTTIKLRPTAFPESSHATRPLAPEAPRRPVRAPPFLRPPAADERATARPRLRPRPVFRHEQWFHADLLEIFGAPVTLDELFAPEFADARAGALAIAAEVFRLSDDRLRVVLVDALEAAASVGFTRFAAHVRASGFVGRLQYFDGRHLAVEDDHELHDEHVDRELNAIRFDEAERAEAVALVDRVFAAFAQIFTALMPSMAAPRLAA
ncbi:hypothetical protein OV090_25270 [Nannocystis sp. RBIL2]|uniref:hypothetical protein n=1 Tax=Nannocystis sp. RBIL2 TaxID=2996788 RepID=UPI00226EEBF1|nr:hypothetical protein [Nannocystis sp. RBIL2]MCY1068078.1 hypothetical protein [Nannocystis sp. RBIL2]